MNLPPEVYGALSVAQNHLNTSRKASKRTRWNGSCYVNQKEKHLAKVQKLVSKAVKYLRGKELP